ncbi:hypothetical protein MAR_003774, partial [Mya arenaria]
KSGPQIHCHFDKYNKTIRTVYLNIDWKGEYLYKNNGLGAKFVPSFRFEEAFIFMTNATRSGYVCSMEFPFKFIPEIKEVMKVEYALNDTSFEEIDEFPSGRISNLVQDFATRRGINLGPTMEETAIFML